MHDTLAEIRYRQERNSSGPRRAHVSGSQLPANGHPLAFLAAMAAVLLGSGCTPRISSEQAAVIAHVEALGGQVKYSPQNRVVEVTLGGTSATGRDLAKLAVFSDLKTLALFDCGIGDDDLAQLRDAKTLETLYLGRTRVTDEGLKHLIGFDNLRSLGLSDTRITDQGLRSLASLKNLRSINVHRTQVTETGGNDLKAALPQVVIHY